MKLTPLQIAKERIAKIKRNEKAIKRMKDARKKREEVRDNG